MIDGCFLRHRWHGHAPAASHHTALGVVLAPAKALGSSWWEKQWFLVPLTGGDRCPAIWSANLSFSQLPCVHSTAEAIAGQTFRKASSHPQGVSIRSGKSGYSEANLWSNANSSVTTDMMVGENLSWLPKLAGKDGTERLAQTRWLILHSENFDEGWCVRPTNRSVSSALPELGWCCCLLEE